MGHKHNSKSRFISANSNNRKFCPIIQRQKFCYETYEKAKRACEYSDNPQRVYYCSFCCAYHTTHYLKKSIEGTNYLHEREKGLRRAMYSDGKVLELKYISLPTQTIRRAFEKNYHPVVKKYLVEYLDASRDDIALSDHELKDGLSKMLKEKDEEVFTETVKWPFCDFKSAMVFYALYYVQKQKFYYGDAPGDLIKILFNENDFSADACDAIEELYSLGRIIVVNEDSSGKRFKFDTFSLTTKKEPSKYTSILKGDEEIDDDPMIKAALSTDYHPAVKELLVQHLRENRFNEEMIQGERLKAYINDSILQNPKDEKAQKAKEETLKWRFSKEKRAWQFLALYYFSMIGPVFMAKPGDIVDWLFVQGPRSKSFMGGVKNVFYSKYQEGKLVITGMKGGLPRYELKD